MEIEEREKLCLETLEELLIDKYVLIGGYGISSFDFPRFSVDLDIVIDGEEKGTFEKILRDQSFSLSEEKVLEKDIYGSKFERYEKKLDGLTVSVDLLINSVVSRQTESSYSFEYLLENSELRDVSSAVSETMIKARVGTREMLIALKTNSMRLVDQRDIIALCTQEVDVDLVLKHLQRCPKETITKNIDELLQTLKSDRHRDSIKGVFRLSDKVYEKITERAIDTFSEIRKRKKNNY